ncbi:MAG TPA: hypothetical protein VMR70_07660 [Flavisolibacter sp.]|nr:hypothetical protein [Flavisolibacter sp.]
METFTISQIDNIVVKKGTEVFLTVKRKFSFRVKSFFYQESKLIFEADMLTLSLYKKVRVRHQDFPFAIEMHKANLWTYSLFCNSDTYSFKVRYFKRPAFVLLKNGIEVATIGGKSLISFGGRFYTMESNLESKEENTLLLIMFLSQLNPFGAGNPP